MSDPQGLAPMPEGVDTKERKLFPVSRVRRWFGAAVVGTPQEVFGVPEGLLTDFYTPEGDRVPPTSDVVTTTDFKLKRVAEVWLRRMMIPRLGQLTSGGLLLVAILVVSANGALSGAKSAWASHEAKAAAAHQEEVQQAQQAAQQKLQAQLAALPDPVRSDVSAMGASCQQLVSDASADKSAPWIRNAGCDPDTGILDVSRAAAFVTQLQATERSTKATLAAPGTPNQILLGMYVHDCLKAAEGRSLDVSGAVAEGCDPATGRLDIAKAQVHAKSMGGQ